MFGKEAWCEREDASGVAGRSGLAVAVFSQRPAAPAFSPSLSSGESQFDVGDLIRGHVDEDSVPFENEFIQGAADEVSFLSVKRLAETTKSHTFGSPLCFH
jgi:hypothetical protein